MAQITLNSSGVASNGILALQSNGTTTAVNVDASQRVGIGVTPSAFNSGIFKVIQVNDQGALFATSTSMQIGNNIYYDSAYKFIGTGYATRYYQASGEHVWRVSTASGTANGAITETQAMTLDASGNLGVGTTSPTAKLHVAGTVIIDNADATNELTFSGTQFTNVLSATTSGFQFGTTGAGYLAFLTNNTERARIDSSGTFLVGATSIAGNVVQIYNNSNQAGRINLNKTSSGLFNALVFTYSGTTVGSIDYSNSGTAFNTSSDIRMKKDIVDAGSASAKIDQIRVVSHGWKHDDEVVEFGFVAQELVNVAPQAVAVGDDGEEIEKTWGVDYSKLVPLLIKAHQEQQALITQLQADVAALKA